MDEKELLHKVLQIIKDVENYTDTFITQDSIPLVEIEIALDKTKSLYDALHQMKRAIIHSQYTNIVETIEEPQAVVVEEEIDFNVIEMPYDEKITEETQQEIVAEQPDVILKEVVDAPLIETPIVQEQIIEIVETSTPIIEIAPEVEQNEPIEVKPSKDVQSKFQIKQDNDLGSMLGKKPLLNISSAIGINDRFQYIKELFNNDVSLYNSTIQTLNAFSDLDAAVELIQKNFTWDLEDPTVQSFLSIVERRYL